ncbi:hypothetical protein F5Y17DRAFT_462416 [Xylariaceae sp. FL0594]|nr:hypothetical protein F5Y17DRAFT_462416 [Xylariaceae sp. FL0594]
MDKNTTDHNNPLPLRPRSPEKHAPCQSQDQGEGEKKRVDLKRCTECNFATPSSQLLQSHKQACHDEQEPSRQNRSSPEGVVTTKRRCPACFFSVAGDDDLQLHELCVHAVECHADMTEEDEAFGKEMADWFAKYAYPCGKCCFRGISPWDVEVHAAVYHHQDDDDNEEKEGEKKPTTTTTSSSFIISSHDDTFTIPDTNTTPKTSYDLLLTHEDGGVRGLMKRKIAFETEIAGRLDENKNIFSRTADYGFVVKCLTTALCHELPSSHFWGNVAFGADAAPAGEAGEMIRRMRKTRDLQTRGVRAGFWNPWNGENTFGGGSDGRGSAWLCSKDRRRIKRDLLAFWKEMEGEYLNEKKGKGKEKEFPFSDQEAQSSTTSFQYHYANFEDGWYGPGNPHKPRVPWDESFDYIIEEVFGPEGKVVPPDEWQACDFFMLGFAFASKDSFPGMRDDLLQELGRNDITELFFQTDRVKLELHDRLKLSRPSSPSTSYSYHSDHPRVSRLLNLLHSDVARAARRMENFTPFATVARHGGWRSLGYRLNCPGPSTSTPGNREKGLGEEIEEEGQGDGMEERAVKKRKRGEEQG